MRTSLKLALIACLVALSARADRDDDDRRRPVLPHASGDGFTFLEPLVEHPVRAGAFDAAEKPSLTLSQLDPVTLAGKPLFTLTMDAARPENRIRVDGKAYRGAFHDLRPGPNTLWRIALSVRGRTLGWVDVLAAGRNPPKPPPGETWLQVEREDADDAFNVRFHLNGCAPVTCTAQDTCHTAGRCDAATLKCSNPVAPEGSACEDGNLCTQNDTCHAGVCTAGAAVACQSPDACHAAGVCQPTTGACINPPPANDGTPCTSADLCQVAATCQAGACVGTPKACATDACASAPSSCQPSTGQCVDAPSACVESTQLLTDELDVTVWDYYGSIAAHWWNYEGYTPWNPGLGTLRKVTVDQTYTMTLGSGPVSVDSCSERIIFFGPGLWVGDGFDCAPNSTITKSYSYELDPPADWVTPASYYLETFAQSTPYHLKNTTKLTYHYFAK